MLCQMLMLLSSAKSLSRHAHFKLEVGFSVPASLFFSPASSYSLAAARFPSPIAEDNA